MQIILLSGGSGKRLWPLSNSTRSKQFLQLLQAPNGQKESMLQRVVRQISESSLDASITIATSESQHDPIENQLNAQINIVTEPERRDTFPAIALSTYYLLQQKGYSRDEVVVAMPCDTYTEANYFEVVAQMAQFAKQGVADLILMGIPPTHPSTDFGYIVPSSSIADLSFQQVQRFIEKPETQKAQELLTQGAYWNGGVFAFRLGFVADIVEQYVKVNNFTELHKRYSELPKISFDYEVAEKAASAVVLPYHGEWKDLGTWNALVEELPTSTIGNVILGKEVKDTTVINELCSMRWCKQYCRSSRPRWYTRLRQRVVRIYQAVCRPHTHASYV